jgi:hypothetical protein
MLGLFAGVCAILAPTIASMAAVPKVETIKVTKRFYVASNRTLLISGTSSNATARLFLYRSSGSPIGEIQNGAGGKYGGSVFFAGSDPVSLTIVSSTGGKVSFTTAPYQP